MAADFNTLTAKQKKVFSAIEAFIKTKGIPPTVREIGEMVGEKTPGAVQGILNRLEQKGVIKREVGMARSIQLVMQDSLYAKPVYIPQLKKVSSRNIDNLFNVYNISQYIPFHRDFLNSDDSVFAFSCPDHGLTEKGVNYGDILFIQRNTPISDSDIVLAIYGDYTLLRQYHSSSNSNSIILESEIDILGRTSFEKDDIQIIGKVIGVYRKF